VGAGAFFCPGPTAPGTATRPAHFSGFAGSTKVGSTKVAGAALGGDGVGGVVNGTVGWAEVGATPALWLATVLFGAVWSVASPAGV
jgi:hypothetical protein